MRHGDRSSLRGPGRRGGLAAAAVVPAAAPSRGGLRMVPLAAGARHLSALPADPLGLELRPLVPVLVADQARGVRRPLPLRGDGGLRRRVLGGALEHLRLHGDGADRDRDRASSGADGEQPDPRARGLPHHHFSVVPADGGGGRDHLALALRRQGRPLQLRAALGRADRPADRLPRDLFRPRCPR